MEAFVIQIMVLITAMFFFVVTCTFNIFISTHFFLLLIKKTIYGIVNKQIPLELLVDPLDQMLKAFAVDEVPMDLHLEISVQMAREISSAFPSSTSSPCHFEPA